MFDYYVFYRKTGRDNLYRCTYVLPDGVTHTKGFVKDPEQAKRYLSVTHGDTSSQLEANKKEMDQLEVTERSENRKREVDFSKNVSITFLGEK